jgi:phage RecT family recombinase
MGELVKQLVDRHRESIVQRLPRYMTPEQFFSLCYALDRNAALARIAQNNPESILNAVLKAADCGLVIGSAYEHCWIIPYKDEAQLQIGWRGLHYQLVRAGAILKLNAACVYDGDEFDITLGDEESIVHHPNLKDDRRRNPRWLFDKANILGAYAVAWLPAAPLKAHRWCPLGEIEAARAKSKVPDGPAWTHFYPAMAQKTAVRRLSKMIEVCGPTEENKEAWERYGRTIELERSQYRNTENGIPDDVPGEKPGKSTPRSGRAAEPAGTEHVTPPPQDGGRKKSSAAPTPPPTKAAAAAPPPPTDELISTDTQNDLIDKTQSAGLQPTWLFDHIQEKYGLGALKHLRQSQAAEIEQVLRTMESEH